jgi:hypothetical protein
MERNLVKCQATSVFPRDGAHFATGTLAMQRILVVVRGPIDSEALGRCCKLEVLERLRENEPYEMAICLVLPEGRDGIHDSIQAQREVTTALRGLMGSRAETVAVLVASDRHGYDADACAHEWGATMVWT